MKAKPIAFSIKFKLLLLLIMLSVLMLVTYATMVLKIVVNDKIAYVYDTILLNSRSVANLIRTETDSAITKTQGVMSYYSLGEHKLSPEGEKWFSAEPQWQRLVAYQFDAGSGDYAAAMDLKKTGRAEGHQELDHSNVALVHQALLQGVVLKALTDGDWILALRLKDKDGSKELVAISEFSGGRFLDIFYKPQVQNTYLTRDAGEIVLIPKTEAHAVDVNALASTIVALPKGDVQHFGVLKSTRENLLVAFADVGIAGFRVVSVIPKSVALQAATLIERESVFFLIFLLSIALFVSVIGASGLTASLKRLHLATLQIAGGNLDVHLLEKGKDEIADVSRGFNKMVSEIKRLLIETAEKVRMQEELKTASLVQSTLFPAPAFASGRVQLLGYYEPASECGGDWWNYMKIGSKIYVVICDATGHGVPAALVTSAAKSAFSVVADLPNMTAENCLAFLNRAIFETTGGKMQMTAVVICIDEVTGQVTIANASHELPFLLRKTAEPLDRKAIELLSASPGPRLGESRDSEYIPQNTRLNTGDCVLFYTDGLTELKDPSGKDMGSRKLIPALVKSFNDGADVEKMMSSVKSVATAHRGAAPLADDLTFLILKVR